MLVENNLVLLEKQKSKPMLFQPHCRCATVLSPRRKQVRGVYAKIRLGEGEVVTPIAVRQWQSASNARGIVETEDNLSPPVFVPSAEENKSQDSQSGNGSRNTMESRFQNIKLCGRRASITPKSKTARLLRFSLLLVKG